MANIKLRKWDTAEYLKTEEDMVLYLQACVDEAGDDAAFIAAALGDVARARGLSQLAKDTGLGRQSEPLPGPGLLATLARLQPLTKEALADWDAGLAPLDDVDL